MKKTNLFYAFIILIFTSLNLSSCKGAPKYTRFDVSPYVTYLEAPAEYNLGQIMPKLDDFKPLEKRQMKKLTSLLTKDDNFVWLKIQFILPDEFKNKEIGMYIGHIHGADILFLNNNVIRQYGEFPPKENSSGFIAQYFMFSKSMLNQNGINTVLIKIWPGTFGSISDKIFLGEMPDIFSTSERMTFFNSKITLSFAGVMIIIFFLYVFLFFVMRKYTDSNVYLFYALLNLYTVCFLLPFFISEISWAKPVSLSYLTMMKLFFYGGAFTTVYFANSFIIAFLKYKDSRPIIYTRLALFLTPLIWSCFLNSYKSFANFVPNLVFFGLCQFAFSIPRLVKSLIQKKRRKDAFMLLAGFSPVLTGVVLDIIIHIGGISSNLPYFTIYGWQITIYIFLSFLLIRFGSMYKHNTELNTKLSQFNTHLEDVVALRTKELSEANYVLSRGLETVAHVQKNFLPEKNRSFRGWDLSISYTPLDNNVSGDLYDYYFTDSVLDGIGIFDVSGHGIPAGLMTILAKGIISQHFITGMNQSEPLSDVLVDINKSYIKEKVNVENYITGLLFRFSEFNKKDVCSVEIANAGHPYPLLYSAEKDEVIELKQSDENKQYGIIGVEGLDVSFPPINLRAAQNDIFVCFTDGLTDALNKEGNDFSKANVISILKKYHEESAIMIMNRIMDAMFDFLGKETITDDVTVIVLKRTNSKDYIEEI